MLISTILDPKNDTYKSGLVILKVPDASGDGTEHTIKGLVDNDIAFKMGNTWGSILPDTSSLSEFSQIVNNANIISWISASSGAWKGTDPFTFNLTFYLITYKYGQSPSIKEQAKHLAKLCALYNEDGKFATVKVHGGYTLNLMDSNNNQLNTLGTIDSSDTLVAAAGAIYTGTSRGLIKMYLGDTMFINNLLLENVQVTPSAVQVEDGVPLFIKIDGSFRTNRALTTGDVERIFGGK